MQVGILETNLAIVKASRHWRKSKGLEEEEEEQQQQQQQQQRTSWAGGSLPAPLPKPPNGVTIRRFVNANDENHHAHFSESKQG